MHALGIMPGSDAELPRVLPPRAGNGSPVDGTGGTGTAPFLAKADQRGKRMQFAIVWSSGDDLGGGVVARADGLNAEMVRGSFDNTDVARVIRKTLFGE
jgi:hypothetical protein